MSPRRVRGATTFFPAANFAGTKVPTRRRCLSGTSNGMAPDPGLTVTAGLTWYLHDRTKRGEISDRTRRSNYHVLSAFSMSIGNPPLERVTRRHIERWQASLSVSGRTRRNYFVTVRSFFRYAHEHGWIAADPTLGMKVPKYHRSVPRQLTQAEMGKLYDACRHSRDRVILTLMIQEGLRCVEVSRLCWDEVDEHNGTILVHGKGGHERVLPLTQAAVRAIEAYHQDIRVTRSGPLVRSLVDDRKGIRPETVSSEMTELFVRAGVRKVPWDGKSAHAARHTMAGDVLRRGGHLRDLQAILGHQSLATTQTYLPLLVNDLRSTMEGRDYEGPRI
jgi:site-specific recombinase XerD